MPLIMYAYHFGLFFIFLMVLQALILAFLPGKSWETRAVRYRWHEWLAVGVVIVCLLFLAGRLGPSAPLVTNPAPPPAAADTLPAADTSLTAASNFRFESVFTIFLLGLLRSAIDVRLPRQNKKPRSLFDAFLVGMAVSLVIDFLTSDGRSFTDIFKQPTGSWWGYAAVCLAAATYMAWIYSLLVRQMTLVEGFSGPVVNRFLVKSLLPEVPLQIVLIGPKKAGKSKIAASVTELEWDDLKDTPHPVLGSFLTRLSNKKRTRVVGSLIDTPGENMGQHLAAAINFRTDSLALVLNSLAFDIARINGQSFSNLKQFASEAFVVSRAANRDYAQGTADYLRTLEVATKGSALAGVDDLAQVYKVHSLAVVIYNEAKHNFSEAGKNNLKSLAEETGKLFALPPECCGAAILNVASDGSVVVKEFADAVAGLALRV